MPQFNDDLYLGAAQGYMNTNQYLGNPADPSPMPNGIGPLGRIYNFDIVPAAPNATALAASQTPAAAGNLTLAAGTSVTSSVNAAGQTVYVLDYPRTILLTGGVGTVSVTVNVYGYDIYGQAMHETITGPTGATTATGKKAFKSVYQISVSGGTTGIIEAGTSNIFGIPLAVVDGGYILGIGWAGSWDLTSGTFTAADTTSPATGSTGDVRGTYAPSTNANGTNRLVIGIAVTGIQAGPQATNTGAFGVTQA